MKLIVVLAALIGVALSDGQADMKYFLYKNQDGETVVEDLVNGVVNLTTAATELTYHFYSRRNPTSSVPIKNTNIAPLSATSFSAAKDTLFIIHGWRDSETAAVNSYIREEILIDHDVNIFVVDWSAAADQNYISAYGSVTKIGGYVADFIVSLATTYRLTLNTVKFVGFSLGAHVSGNAGAALNGQVDRIVGLDPAGPLFTAGNINNRLDPTDARFVQVIHTNDGGLGFNGRLGHADYYPNGGRAQPGCGTDGGCAHGRAFYYYAESLNTNRFVARLCASYDAFSAGQCNSAATSFMGMFNVDTRANGQYFLITNDRIPFARG